MPRHRRIIRPGDLVHVISRFVNRELRLTCDTERSEYQRRFGDRFRASDWRALSYALMGTHVHHALIAGTEPFEQLIKSIHAPFAGWLNQRQGRLGPVFAGRPKTLVVDPVWAGRLIAYHHNNPPRAGVVESALDSDWTSHRAYVGVVEPPDFLAVDLGLALMGFNTSPAGREAFALYVEERQSEPRDPALVGDLRAARNALREQLGAAVCIAHPNTGPGGCDYLASTKVARWHGSPEAMVELVARACGLTPHEIGSSSRCRRLVAARRQVAILAALLGHSSREVGLYLGISEAAVRKLRATASDRDRAEASSLIHRLVKSAA